MSFNNKHGKQIPVEENFTATTPCNIAEKICIIAVYFGVLPNTFPLWLKSALNNPTVDFLIVTDQSVHVGEKNIRVLSMSFDQCKNLIARKLKMKVCITKPYKLCDFKPVYGVIFDDYLKEYTYWGHCDLDMLFGNIEYFLEKYRLSAYDKFLSEGHLALYRNTEKCNRYYILKGSYYYYKEVFSQERNFIYDEGNKINGIYSYNAFPLFDDIIYANINPSLKRFQCCGVTNYTHQVFSYENGRIIRHYLKDGIAEKDEFMYIHLLKRKMPDPDNSILISDVFYINEDGYHIDNGEYDLKSKACKLYCYNGRIKDILEKIENVYRYKWTIFGLKRRLSIFLFKYSWGRRVLGKDF